MRTLLERFDVNGSSIVVKMSEHGQLLFEIEERPNEKPQRCWLDVNDVLRLTYEASRRTIGGGIEQITAALKPFAEAIEAAETQADSDDPYAEFDAPAKDDGALDAWIERYVS